MLKELDRRRAYVAPIVDWRGAAACLNALYDASISGLWEDALGAVAAAFDVDTSALVERAEDGGCTMLAGRGIPDGRLAEPLASWVARIFVVSGKVLQGGEVPWLRAAGCTSSLFVGSTSEGGRAVLCCLGWARRHPPPGTAERLVDLAPHLGRAVAIRQLLRRVAGEAELTAAVLDRVTLGAVLVDEGARPLLANRAALRVADEGDGFRLEQRGLRGASATQTRALRQLVATVSRRRGGSLGERGGTLRLHRPSGRTPYEVLVLPLPRGEHGDACSDAVAVVFVTNPEHRVQTPEQFIRGLYNLTPAEARLAMLLARGHTLSEAGDLLGVSRNTVHTHLSRIFLKTGTSRQSELVRRLLTAPARLAAEESSGYKPVVGDE